ncbi:NACHT domain-containing protein [Aeromicrobium sp. 179-A 4D2 NHS]|uniref:NACHT domain-containing protein n=1 Tax=Aeromicrobium sp. 179-A 4D2 NHS TaxID=3142375 RepID=UPI0039A2A1C8
MNVNLQEIRQHGGSQQNAWEELAYQLRPPVGSGHVETRKTRAPDAGVEWYEVYADGHVEGFQAKFHGSLADALGGMRESVTSACAKRPTLTRLTFVLPYDFTDTGEGKRKSDQDRWADAVKGWHDSIPGAEHVEFRTLLAGDVLSELARAQHSGRRAFWFGALELSDDWFAEKLKEAKEVAGERYTPEADTDVAVNLVVEACAAGDRFLGALKAQLETALAACRRNTGIWGSVTADAVTWMERLDTVKKERFGERDGDGSVALVDFDIDRARKAVDTLLACTLTGASELPEYSASPLRAAQDALYELSDLLASEQATAYSDRALAVSGPAGSGKTHTILRVAERLHAEGSPVVVLHGQRFADGDWWTSLRAMLDIGDHRAADFLQALDSLGEARGHRAVILIDALNESKDPRRWSSELVSLLTQTKQHPHVAVVVSFRNDYRTLIEPPKTLATTRHFGFRGEWLDAVAAYCRTYKIAMPSTTVFDPGFANPLFLRMWCEVVRDRGPATDPSRSTVFDQFAAGRMERVRRQLRLAPTSTVVREALDIVLDSYLESGGQPVLRTELEPAVDALLPNREWPNTLFSVMHSEGLFDLYPWGSGVERVAFPFQAFGEHLIARRLVANITDDDELGPAVSEVPWLWRALAVLLPEQRAVELVDVVNGSADGARVLDAMRDSLVERHHGAFSDRAISTIQQLFAGAGDQKFEAADILIGLGPRLGHPANADWLHGWLIDMPMAERDALWSVASYTADEGSGSLRRLRSWAANTTPASPDEEIALAATTFMWLLTSPNRYLRDTVTRSLTDLLSRRLNVGGMVLAKARSVDDPYVHERVLLACYGALMIAGDRDPSGAQAICAALADWPRDEMPVHVLARDSARGIAHWAESRGHYNLDQRAHCEPPFTSSVPVDPPTAEELEADYGVVKSGGTYGPWRAYAILSSCLTWMGDFHKYVMKSDVQSFSRFPLSGPEPSGGYAHPLARTDEEWAGRWIAHRAIGMGWTPERFEDFEHEYARDRGRESHKAERFGKKYQWIALHELLARLADNFHLASDVARTYGSKYQGPWTWYGRDLDPCLPLPGVGVPQHLALTGDKVAKWAALEAPDLQSAVEPDRWVEQDADLCRADQVFRPIDDGGRQWVALQRYASWDRSNAARSGMYKRERDVFHLHFSWLVPGGDGGKLLDLFRKHTLRGRWMDDSNLIRGRYVGELGWAPIAKAPILEEPHFDHRVREAGIFPLPAVEQYLWEGSALDCSLDASVDFYVPTDRLLGDATWSGDRAEWQSADMTVARSIEVHDGEDYQSVLVADPSWLRDRLAATGFDLVVGVLGERHALPRLDNPGDEFDGLASSDFWYGMVMSCDGSRDDQEGPVLTVHRGDMETAEEEENLPAALGIITQPADRGSEEPSTGGDAG